MKLSIVFLNPESFSDTKTIVEHIDNDSIVHININGLETKDQQRVIDFISGASYLKGSKLIQPGVNIFCTIPEGAEYSLIGNIIDGSSTVIDLRHDEEEEIKPSFF